MIEVNKQKFFWRLKEVWFADTPYDVSGVDRIIFYDCKNMINKREFVLKEFTTSVIDLTNSIEKIWNNMDKSSCRYMITRAERECIKIKIDEHFNEFYSINNNFRRLKGLTPSVNLEDYKKFGHLFTAEYKGEVVGGQFYLSDENNFRWLLGASKRLSSQKEESVIIGCANRLIVWRAINYAKEHGKREFDLGGIYTGEAKNVALTGIARFKNTFGGRTVSHFVYIKDYSKIYKFMSYLKQKLFL
jgi:hypothetical protein